LPSLPVSLVVVVGIVFNLHTFPTDFAVNRLLLGLFFRACSDSLLLHRFLANYGFLPVEAHLCFLFPNLCSRGRAVYRLTLDEGPLPTQFYLLSNRLSFHPFAEPDPSGFHLPFANLEFFLMPAEAHLSMSTHVAVLVHVAMVACRIPLCHTLPWQLGLRAALGKLKTIMGI
jgi:hypothetical protein